MSPRPRIQLLLRAQPDARLAALAADGVEPAFAALVERYRGELRRSIARSAPETVADDVLQDTFLRAWRALQDGETVEQPRAWLHRIAANAAIDSIRRGLRHDELRHAVEAPGAVEDEVERRRLIRAALTGLAQLPDSQRRALLSTAVGCSRAEVAAQLGISEGAVRQLVHRGRAALRQGMAAAVPAPLLLWAVRRAGPLPVTEERLAELASGAGTAGGAALLTKGAGAVAVVLSGATVAAAPSLQGASSQPAPPREPRVVAASATAEPDDELAARSAGDAAERRIGRDAARRTARDAQRDPRRETVPDTPGARSPRGRQGPAGAAPRPQDSAEDDEYERAQADEPDEAATEPRGQDERGAPEPGDAPETEDDAAERKPADDGHGPGPSAVDDPRP